MFVLIYLTIDQRTIPGEKREQGESVPSLALDSCLYHHSNELKAQVSFLTHCYFSGS